MDDIGYDYLAKIKRTTGNFKANGVYWCGSKFINFDPYVADKHSLDLFPQFKPGMERLLIVRGGIGDLLGLSVLHDVAPEILVITTRSLFPILDWWQTPPKRVSFNEPLFTIKYPKKVKDYCQRYGVQHGDEMIVAGSRENWYHIFARSVGHDFLGGRPKLNPDKTPDAPNRIPEKTILLVNKATSVNRTADLETMIQALPDEWGAAWYDDNRELWYRAPKGKWASNFETFVADRKTSLNQFLADLYYADMVVSVDTSAIHFREGIGKPALGVYSSFTAESRTKYYEYTKSIDIKSECAVQPCFINFKQCHVAKKTDKYAPCLSRYNESFVKQLKEHLWTYLNDGDFAWPAMSRPSATL